VPDSLDAPADEWLSYAERDLKVARIGVDATDLADLAAFHAQQAIEKCLKAMCVFKRVPFEKTHDLGYLLRLVRSFDPAFAERWSEAKLVTEYAIAGRYPLDVGPYAVPPARAVQLAAEVLEAARQWLGDQPER